MVKVKDMTHSMRMWIPESAGSRDNFWSYAWNKVMSKKDITRAAKQWRKQFGGLCMKSEKCNHEPWSDFSNFNFVLKMRGAQIHLRDRQYKQSRRKSCRRDKSHYSNYGIDMMRPWNRGQCTVLHMHLHVFVMHLLCIFRNYLWFYCFQSWLYMCLFLKKCSMLYFFKCTLKNIRGGKLGSQKYIHLPCICICAAFKKSVWLFDCIWCKTSSKTISAVKTAVYVNFHYGHFQRRVMI